MQKHIYYTSIFSLNKRRFEWWQRVFFEAQTSNSPKQGVSVNQNKGRLNQEQRHTLSMGRHSLTFLGFVVNLQQLLQLLSCSCWCAAAFRPPDISEELGCSPTLSLIFGRAQSGNDNNNNKPFFFDPLGFSDDVNFAHLRECELKHCRICMIATTATLVVPFLKSTNAYVVAFKV